MPTTRRTLLEALGATVAVGGVAGCFSLGAANETPTESDTRTPSTTRSDTSTDTTTRTPGPDPQPPPARDLFDGVPCPSFEDADRTVCWHTRADDEIAIEPSQPVFRPVAGNDEVETITFTLRNTWRAPIVFNPYSWAVKRRTDDGWTHVAPDGAYKPLFELDPGQTYRWVLSRRPHSQTGLPRAVHSAIDFENGRHAFVLTGSLLDPSPNTTTADGFDGTTVEWVTLFDVQRVYL